MMKKLMIFIAAITFLFSGTAFAQTSTDNSPVQKEQEKSPFDGVIKFDKETVDFGVTKKGEPATVTYTFTNVSQKPVIIKSAQPSCGCTTPSWTKKPILPGKKGEIKATYNAEALGQISKTVFVNFQGIPQTKELRLTGKVTK